MNSPARKNTNGATGAAHDAYKPQGETQACTSGSSIKRKVKIQLDSIKRKVKIQLEKGGKWLSLHLSLKETALLFPRGQSPYQFRQFNICIQTVTDNS